MYIYLACLHCGDGHTSYMINVIFVWLQSTFSWGTVNVALIQPVSWKKARNAIYVNLYLF